MIVVAVAGDVVDVFVAVVVVVATESQQHLEPRDRKLP